MKDMILAAVIAAVDSVSDKNDSVKQDIVSHLTETVLNDEQVNNAATQLSDMIVKLGEQFEKMSLPESQLISYLMEMLDLPRNNLRVDGADDLLLLANKSEENPDEITIVPSKLGLSTLPNGGVVPKFEDNDNTKAVQSTIVYLKLSATKLVLFVLTTSVAVYMVNKSGDNLLVEKQKGYTHHTLGQSLETLIDTEFAPKLMSERESVPVSDLDADWLEAYVNDNPDVLEGLTANDSHPLMNKIVTAYAEISNIDVEGKRLELEHHDALLEKAVQILSEQGDAQSKAVEASLAAHDTVDDVEATPVEDNTPLFSEGVVEQSVETTTPEVSLETEDLFVTDEVEEDNFDNQLDTVELAVDILNKLGDEPQRGLLLIENSQLPIKDSLYREVFNTLPSIEKRTSASYTEEERETITAALDDNYRDVLGKIEVCRVANEKLRIESLPYKPEMIEKAIKDSPVHSSLIESDEKRAAVAEQTAQYLNDNDPDVGVNAVERINSILLNLSLFGYERESLINSTYRATNVPSKENLIRNTPVISTTLRKVYTQVEGWDKDKSDAIKDALDEVNSNTRSGLDLDDNTINIILDGSLKEKQFTRVGGYIVVSAPVTVPEKSLSLVTMTSSQARVFNIDRETKRVISVVDINKPAQRNDLLAILMNH